MSALAEDKSKARKPFLAPNTILQNRYRIVQGLGNGGMGAVYEAIDLRLSIRVALKETLTADEDLSKHFEREARLMARLNHPALPRVTDYFTEDCRAFFVMQFIEGPDLGEIIARQPGPFPRPAVIAWADQLLDALIYLHSQERQIIHRDIKPHNLKITRTGQIALLDFGLAKSESTDHSLVTSTSIFGYTPRYAPLEQIQDLGTTPQSDIYALGATLYHLLTGVKPPDAVARAVALVGARPNPLKPANEINPAVGPELAAILDRAMAQDANQRYASAAEFRAALRRLGRVDCPTGINYIEPELVSTDKLPAPKRFGAITYAMIFLLAAFGVFCRYYNWKLPSILASEEVLADISAVGRAGNNPAGGRRPPERALVAAQPRASSVDNDFHLSNRSPIVQRSREKTSFAAKAIVRLMKVNPTNVRSPERERYSTAPIQELTPDKGLHGTSIVKHVLFAPDGTRVLTFADGVTRAFRPGEQITRANESQ